MSAFLSRKEVQAHMVRPVSFKGFQGVSLRGFRGFQIFLWELCVCIKYLSLGDPCAGSGHILCVLFDVLVNIYEDYGYTAREAAVSIVQNNLWGLDINDRAAQLAYFAVMMKARQYDRRFLARGIQPHVYSVTESNGIDRAAIDAASVAWTSSEKRAAVLLLNEMMDAKEYGSMLQISGKLSAELSRLPRDFFKCESVFADSCDKLRQLCMVAIALAQKYHIVVTNPPYLGSSRFSSKLDAYVKANWPDVKSDLSMVMYQHAIDDMVLPEGFVSFITTSSWMFLSSFEKMRMHVNSIGTLSALVDYGTELFEGKVGHNPIVSWTIRKRHIRKYILTAVRLVDYCYARRDEKEPQFLSGKNRYVAQQDNFNKIPGAPVAY